VASTPSPADAARSALARAFVHEVRSPLNALGIYVDLMGRMSEHSDGGPTPAQLVERAERQLRRVDELLEVLLAVWAPALEVDLAALLTAAGRLAGHEAVRRGAALNVVVDGPAPINEPAGPVLDALFQLLDVIWSAPEPHSVTLRLKRTQGDYELEVDGMRLDTAGLSGPFARAGGTLVGPEGRMVVRFASADGRR
jgi:hypothetical protein